MKKRGRHLRNTGVKHGGLSMTPMIDVVFLLLIFFIITIKPEDVLGRLIGDQPNSRPDAPSIAPVSILIGSDDIYYNGRAVSFERLDNMLGRLAGYDSDLFVSIKCAADSRHGRMVRVMDLCAKHDLKRITVSSGE